MKKPFVKIKPLQYFILFFFSFFILNTNAAEKSKPATTTVTATKPVPKKYATVPSLKKGEYAVFIEDSYKVFKTKKFEDFELETSCFKNEKPKCDAYSFAQVKPKPITLKHEGLNNFAAIHCSEITGKNLIAFDDERKEYNFCLFRDGSMVNSWSVYFKYHPVPVIK